MTLTHIGGLVARILGFLWLDAWLLFRYWVQLHPTRDMCGFAGVGCEINTGLYLALLAGGVALLAFVLDLGLRRPKDLEDFFWSVMHGLVIGVAAGGMNFAAEKQPEFRAWIFSLIGVQ
jgi:hypothetical protein